MSSISKQCKGGTLHLVKIPKRYQIQVAKTAERTLTEAGKLFEYQKSVEIAIFSSHPEVVIPELGIGGNSIYQGDIVINIDFSRKDIAYIIKKELPSALYHELSHIVREATVGYGETLLEALASEGIGSYVENRIFHRTMPYTKQILHELKYWQKAKRLLKKKPYNHFEWFFGTKKLPRWIGYRLGYLLVDSFMKRQKNLSLSQLVRTKSHEILRGAGDIYNLTLRLKRTQKTKK